MTKGNKQRKVGVSAPVKAISPHSAVFNKERLDKLRAMLIMDTPHEAQFDRLTELATQMLDVPIALVSLVDDERQFFKCSVGLPEPWASERNTPLSHSFCQHVVDEAEPLILEDARDHDVLRENLAIAELGVVAYAGIPLITSDGYTIGTFCAIDTKPRSWTGTDIKLLTVFAAAAMTAIELHLERDMARTGEIQLEASLDELKKSQADLVTAKRMEAVGQLTAGVAHQFNNILQVIMSAVEITLEDMAPDDPNRELLRDAASASHRGAQVVQQLLTFTADQRAAQGPLDVKKNVDDLRSFLRATLGVDVPE